MRAHWFTGQVRGVGLKGFVAADPFVLPFWLLSRVGVAAKFLMLPLFCANNVRSSRTSM